MGPTGEFSSVVLEKTPPSEYIFKKKVVDKNAIAFWFSGKLCIKWLYIIFAYI